MRLAEAGDFFTLANEAAGADDRFMLGASRVHRAFLNLSNALF